MSSVPIFAPDGSYGEVPYEQFKAAVAAGAKPAVRVQAPDGSFGHVPADRFPDAVKAGAKPAPLEDQPKGVPDYYGFTPKNLASNALEGAKGVVKGAYELGKDILSNPNWITGPNSTYEKFVGAPAEGEARKASAAFGQGHYVEAAGHELAGALPLVGPAAAQIGEQAGTGDVGGAAAKGAAQVLAARAGSELLSKTKAAANPLLGSQAERMYQSTLKPSLAKNAPAPAELIKTGLANEIPISRGGVDKLSTLIDDLQQKVSDTISADPSKTVNKFAVASRLGKTAQKFATQVNPGADLEAISQSGNEFLANQPGQIPVEQAQALKVGTYRQLKGRAYGELKSASIEAQKSLARGIKEELVQQFPELSRLNAQEGRLIDLDGALEKAVARMDNHQLIGLGTTAAGGAGGAIAGGGGAVVGAVLKTIIDNPIVKSRIAIALNRASKANLGTVNSRLSAYSAALSGAATSQNSDDQTTP